MPLPSAYKQYIFDERPTEQITPTTFKSETKSTSDLKVGPGQVLIKVTWISLDPAMRSWLNDSKRAYTPPVKLGEVMRAAGLGVVVQVGEGSKFAIGDQVSGLVGQLYQQTTPIPEFMVCIRRLEGIRCPRRQVFHQTPVRSFSCFRIQRNVLIRSP